jgi:cell wall-associated NlpC family hydrolase
MRALSIIAVVTFAVPASALASTGGATYPGSAPLNGGSSPGQADGPRTGTGGRAPSGEAESPTPAAPAAPPGTATLMANGKARAPSGAPAAVRRALRAGNRLQGKPYRFGGGHVRWEDDAYDCSGATSYALRGIGGLNTPLDSTAFMHWGEAGAGRWITSYANPKHVFVVIAGLRLDTGTADGRGPRWQTAPRPTMNFTARHPTGL